jgi:hypothetical protein
LRLLSLKHIAIGAALLLPSVHARASVSYPSVPAGVDCILGCVDNRTLSDVDLPVDLPQGIEIGTPEPDLGDAINSFLGSTGAYAAPDSSDEDQNPGDGVYGASLVIAGLLFSAMIGSCVAIVRLHRRKG